MRTIFLLHLLPFLHSSPEPDTQLHVYLPPESGQGKLFSCCFFLICFFKGGKPDIGGGTAYTGGAGGAREAAFGGGAYGGGAGGADYGGDAGGTGGAGGAGEAAYGGGAYGGGADYQLT